MDATIVMDTTVSTDTTVSMDTTFFMDISVNSTDMSPFTNTTAWVPKTLEERVNLLWFFGVETILAIITCFGNLVVLIAYAITPQLRQRNKMMTALVLNLAVTDLFNGALAIPWFIIPHYAYFEAKDNKMVCILSYMFPQYSLFASVLTTQAIAIERYVAIAHAFWRPPKIIRRIFRKWIVLTFLWVYPAVVLAGLTAPEAQKSWDVCEQSVVLSPYHNVVMAAHLFTVLILSSCLYGKIIRTVRTSKKSVEQFGKSGAQTRAAMATNNGHPEQKGKDKKRRTAVMTSNDIRVVKTLALLMVIFYLCFVPVFLKILARLILGLPTPEPFWLNLSDQFVIIFLMLAPCLDPFIYGWRNVQLRKVIFAMFCRHSSKKYIEKGGKQHQQPSSSAESKKTNSTTASNDTGPGGVMNNTRL